MKCRTPEDYRRKQRIQGFPRPTHPAIRDLRRAFRRDLSAYAPEPLPAHRICLGDLQKLFFLE